MRTPSASPTQRRSSHAPPRQASMVRARIGTPTQMTTVARPNDRPVASSMNQNSPMARLATR
jgi:hypothetical protein